MKFLHPAFMLLLIGFLYKIYKTGKQVDGINVKSPEADRRADILADHAKTAQLVTALMIPGFIGGIIGVVYFLGIKEVFIRTYGHGFIGAGVLGLMLSNLFVGRSIKRPAKASARENLLSFHRGLMYFVLAASAGSIATGFYILFAGPSA
ncbi:MAG: DUF4079 family protein [Candidatus Riflebacteria bacterium]